MDDQPLNNAQPQDVPPEGSFAGGNFARLEDLYGYFPRTTTAPTWTPRRFLDSFAIDTTNNLFYFYNFVSHAWKTFLTLSQNIIDALNGAASPTSGNVFATMSDIVTSATRQNLIAGEAITAGDAVCAAFYQSDGGVLVDTTSHGHTLATSFIATINVAAHTNRIMIAVITVYSTTISNVAYDSNAMTLIDSTTQGNVLTNIYYLVAPDTGSNNLTATIGSASNYTCFAVYSLYNASQTGQPSAHAIAQQNGNTALPVSLTPAETGDFVIAYTSAGLGGGAFFGDIAAGFLNNIMQDTGIANPQQAVADNGQAINTVAQTATTVCTASGTLDKIAGIIAVKPITAASYGYVKRASAASAAAYAVPASDSFRQKDFIGFANASASVSTTVSVYTAGIFANISGLIPLAQYYLSNSLGQIATTPGTITRKAAIAVSSAMVAITNVW